MDAFGDETALRLEDYKAEHREVGAKDFDFQV